MAGRFCILTKTYAGDFDAFVELCASIDRLMPEVAHYVVIDRRDRALFAPLAGARRIFLESEELLPRFHPFRFMGRPLWYHFPKDIVRGWIFQQLAKLKAVSQLQEEAVVLVDSDVIFIRPLTEEHVFSNGKVKLYHRPGAQSGPADQSDKWHNVASRALGLPENGYTGADYISTVIAWSPDVVRALLAHIETVTGKIWHRELLKNFRFSECVLYGVFCEKIAGDHGATLAPTREALCHWNWSYDLSNSEGIADFVEGLQPHHVAVLAQSNLGLPISQRKEIYRLVREKALQAVPDRPQL